jgi:hypothetical protein
LVLARGLLNTGAMKKPTKTPVVQPALLSTDDLRNVTGGDPASGLPTGKRMHKPYTSGVVSDES